MTNKKSNSFLEIFKKCFLSFLGKLLVFLIISTIFLLLIRVIPGNITYEYSTENLRTGVANADEGIISDAFLLRGENGTVEICDISGTVIKSASLDFASLTEYDIQLLSEGIRGEISTLEHLMEELLS